MEQENTNQIQTLQDGDNSWIDRLLRTFALPLIIAAACLIILFGLIIREQANAAMGGLNNSSEPALTPDPTEVLGATDTAEPTPTQALFTIIVDAGHGGFDPGAIGYSNSNEDDINLAIARILRGMLTDNGYGVIMTRDDEEALADTKEGDMQARDDIITGSGADMFISIHQNSFPDDISVRGPEVYYHDSEPEEGKALAQCVQDALDSALNVTRSRGIRFYDHRLTSHMPCSILVECGFISSPEEEASLLTPEYQERIAQAIFTGIENYLSAAQA